MNSFTFSENDRSFSELYRDFLPKRIIDAHMHLWQEETIPSFYKDDGIFFRKECTPLDYEEDMKTMFPGVEQIDLMMMTFPDPAMADTEKGLRDRANRYIASYTKQNPEKYAMAPYVLYRDTEEEIEDMLLETNGCAIKVYGFSTGSLNISDLSIRDFLPESAWVVAQKKKIPIILHILKPGCLSDEENFSYITEMTNRYPDAPLVLAHCARSFAAWTGIRKIQELSDHGNIWFDMSAICESGPMMACIMKNAAKRTMWGSDYPNSMYRGRAVSVGKWQNWLTELDDPGRVYLGQESLMAFYQAALLLNLDAGQIEDIFCHNAEELYFHTFRK